MFSAIVKLSHVYIRLRLTTHAISLAYKLW